MNLFVCGQRSFGREVLKRLISDGHTIVGVAVPPQDKYYDKMHALAIKERVGVILNADRLVSSDVPEGVDLIVAAHSHHFISGKVRAKARRGAIGFHPSLLPRHRGRDAVRWTVAMRDPVAGASIYWLDGVTDGGPIFSQRFFHVGKSWSYHHLWKVIFPAGVDMVADAVRRIENGQIIAREQDGRFATWEPAFTKDRLFRPELAQLPRGEGASYPAKTAAAKES